MLEEIKEVEFRSRRGKFIYYRTYNSVGLNKVSLADHLPVFVVRKYARENLNRQSSRIKYRDMKSFDKDQFKRTLEQIPWETAFVFEDVDDVVYAWEKMFNSALDDHCPWREKRIKHTTQPPWMIALS